MKAKDIILQLQKYLPIYTDLFSTNLSVSSMTYSGGKVTVTTSSEHNLSNGDIVNVTGALAPNPITTLTHLNGIATAITQNDHDLTEGYQETINITGAIDSEFNGDKKLLSVPNRRSLTFEVDESAPASTTGAILNEDINFGYNGGFNVTILSPTIFEYSTLGSISSPATGAINLKTKIRVSGSVGISKAELAYTKQVDQNNYWAFVVLDDSPASKSRQTLNDADMVFNSGTDPRQKIIQNFSVYVFAPCKTQIAARETRDNMNDVLACLIRALVGYKPPTNLCEGTRYGITFVGHEFFSYTDSTYIHRFQFQNLVDITFGDTLRNDRNRAFRDIHIDYVDPIVSDGDDIIMTSDINLDGEPLS